MIASISPVSPLQRDIKDLKRNDFPSGQRCPKQKSENFWEILKPKLDSEIAEMLFKRKKNNL